MEEAARTVFRNEVGLAMKRVTVPLQDVATLARRGARPREGWLLHAETAALASVISWAMAAWMWLRQKPRLGSREPSKPESAYRNF